MFSMNDRPKYVTVSIPRAVADRIDYFVENLGFWPSRSSFVREAVLEKFTKENGKIVPLRTIAEYPPKPQLEKKKDASRIPAKPE
jgi:Arc/MetJ-type ribon-helix-helix transcriptional regulator